MKIIIVATKTCRHRPLLERQFQEIGISYSVLFVEDQPELIERYAIQNSPNIVVGEELVFRGMPEKQLPTQSELKQLLRLAQGGAS